MATKGQQHVEEDNIERSGLEVDTAAYAPQRCSIADGLQQPDYSGKQLTIDRTALHPHLSNAPLIPVVQEKIPQDRSSKLKWFVAGFGACFMILAISLGVGLGVGLKQKTSGTASSIMNVSDSNSSTQHGVLPDTSLSAIGTLDGNRHMFFQDKNGSIRHATFGQSINSWISQADYVYTNVVPKNHTPLSTILITTEGNRTDLAPNEIHLFYIGLDDTVQAVSYFTGDPIYGSPVFTTTLPAATNTRSLVVNQLSVTQANTFAEAALFFEAPNGNVTIMHGFYYGSSESPSPTRTLNWVWHNVSDTIHSIVGKNDVWLAAPFTSTPLLIDNLLSTDLWTASLNPRALDDTSAAPAFLLSLNGWQNLTLASSNDGYTPEANHTSLAAIQSGDLLLLNTYISQNGQPGVSASSDIAWVENGTLFGNTPPSAFPYARLASWANVNASVSYVYHQLDDTTLVEDMLLVEYGWKTTNITITP